MDIEEIKIEALKAIEENSTSSGLNEEKIKYLGRNGLLTGLLRQIGSLQPEEKKIMGQKLNDTKLELEKIFDIKISKLEELEKKVTLEKEKIDVTLPGRSFGRGSLHPISIVEEELTEVFHRLGFVVRQGPEIETDFYNFEALNIPKWHPARALQDTFYIEGDKLLRTHTSPIQIRTMMNQKPPIRMIALGRCYRRDALDATHSPYFTQVEGLMIDKNISFADLAGILSIIFSEVFGGNVSVKFQPTFFPFVEPGAETLASCPFCKGEGCSICKYQGWIEMGGSGMVHPKVLENVGYDPEEYQGFAFGWGVERIAMMKFNIKDIRDLYANDLRFITQFGGVR